GEQGWVDGRLGVRVEDLLCVAHVSLLKLAMCKGAAANASPERSSRVSSSGGGLVSASGARAGIASCSRRELPVAEAARDVVVDEARRLHARVADRRSDEAKAPALEVLAHRLRLLRLRRQIAQRARAADD